MKRRIRSKRGFTIVEVLATLVLLGIVIPSAMRAMSGAMQAASTARHKVEAATLAQAKLNELVITGDWSVSGGSGDFGQEWPEYRWTCENTAFDTGVTQLSLTVVWNERRTERSFNLTTLVVEQTTATTPTT